MIIILINFNFELVLVLFDIHLKIFDFGIQVLAFFFQSIFNVVHDLDANNKKVDDTDQGLSHDGKKNDHENSNDVEA